MRPAGRCRAAELADLQQHVGPRLLAAEPALVQALLLFSNGFSVGPFEFYKASGVGMATVTFKTLYVGDLSPAFRKRACFFGGTSPLLDVGVVLGPRDRPRRLRHRFGLRSVPRDSNCVEFADFP